ncbi:hypothetical protein [Geomonas oryzae]|uniref:hypothetical protein n=1 Tax=Geomonas oryzae TaxID=2364273 RepID=UPI00100BA43F|nr:hypothetical protein [Geomonas oryzae]
MLRLLIMMLVLVTQSGCAHHAKEQIEIFRSGAERNGKAAVFLRLRPANGSPGACVHEFVQQFGYANKKLEVWSLTREKKIPLKEVLHLLPVEKGSTRWLVMLLDPGSYYLNVERQPFFLGIPETGAAVYAGSLDLQCGFDQKGDFAYSYLTVADERVAANELVPAGFDGAPGIPCLISRYGQPLSSNERTPQAMGLISPAMPTLQAPGWKKRSVLKALGFGGEPRKKVKEANPPNTLEVTGQFFDAIGAGYVIPMAYLTYAPFGSLYGVVKGGLDEKRYRVCLDDIGHEIERLDLAQETRSLIEEAFPKGTAVKGSQRSDAVEVNGRVGSIQFTRVKFGECFGDMSFCIEVAALAQIRDVAERRNVFAEMLVYRNPSSLLSEVVPFEIEIAEASKCRHIDSYCGSEDKKIIRDELSRAVRGLLRRALSDFGCLNIGQQTAPLQDGTVHDD